ncbi:MAG: hypothetical protein ABI867_14615 [Kofleriaceae bacterium]
MHVWPYACVLVVACSHGAPEVVTTTTPPPTSPVAVVTTAEPTPPPPVPVKLAAWRTALAEAEHLAQLQHPAFDVPGGVRAIEGIVATANAALVAEVAQLPDASPDLAEAVCRAADKMPDRGVRETQLVRAIAAARGYESLHGLYLSVEVGYDWRSTKLVRHEGDGTLSGIALASCDRPDAGHLRMLLADLYSGEQNYPNNPFTGEVYKGTHTTQRGKRGGALRVLEALYRDVTAAADEAATATVLEFAWAHCDGKVRAPICLERGALSRRALALREHALPAGSEALAETRILHARLTKRDAEAAYRRVLADVPSGTAVRLYAELDLYALLRARKDVAGARAVEATFLVDLAKPAGIHTWAWATIAETWAEAIAADGRGADAAAVIGAAIVGLALPNPLCPDFEGCSNREYVKGLLEKQADYDANAAPKLRERARVLGNELGTIRTARADEVRRRMAMP